MSLLQIAIGSISESHHISISLALMSSLKGDEAIKSSKISNKEVLFCEITLRASFGMTK